jgi:hypothetical protein
MSTPPTPPTISTLSAPEDDGGQTLAVRIDQRLVLRLELARAHMTRLIRAAGGKDPTLSDVVRRALLLGSDEIMCGADVEP